MIELLTPHARVLLKKAQANAVLHHEETVGCNAILLTLCDPNDGTMAIEILRHLGVDLGAFKEEIEQTTIRGGVSICTEPTLTPRVKRVLDNAYLEARGDVRHVTGDIHIGTEHILLGLLQEEDTDACRLLNKFGVCSENVIDAIAAITGVSIQTPSLVPSS